MKVESLLLGILQIQSPSNNEDRMIDFIKNYCVSKGYRVDVIDKNVYVVKGSAESYPCYVAHTDTCAKFVPDDEFSIVTLDNQYIAGFNYKKDKFTQVGFDDKLGIFIALKMLSNIPAGKAFFPYGEEVGCLGTNKAEMDFFLDCGYVIQCDRRNAKGVVDSISGMSLFGDDFRDVLKTEGTPYKRTFTSGMMTDVQRLKSKGLTVACTNLECGYYNPHTDDDYCNIDELYETYSFVHDVYKATVGQIFPHKYEPPKYSGYNNYGYGNVNNHIDYSKKKATQQAGTQENSTTTTIGGKNTVISTKPEMKTLPPSTTEIPLRNTIRMKKSWMSIIVNLVMKLIR